MPQLVRPRALSVIASLFALVASPSCGSDAASSTPPPTPTVCTPGAIEECYSGAAETRGLGACKAGTHTCNPDGLAFGACEGEVLPQTETCTTSVDDDCDGRVNEDGEGCNCVPGSVASCFTGPATARGVGACKDGKQTCRADGSGYEPCTGDVLPAAETCDDALVDEDCDGQ